VSASYEAKSLRGVARTQTTVPNLLCQSLRIAGTKVHQ